MATKRPVVIDLDDDGEVEDHNDGKRPKPYRIPRKEGSSSEPSAAAPLARRFHGTIVAFTTAKRADGAQGRCIAAFTEDGSLMRLCADHGDAAPFWDRSLTEGLHLGVQVEYEPASSGQPSPYPHRTDDQYASALRPLAASIKSAWGPSELVKRLAPHAKSALRDVWPHPHFKQNAKRPCVVSGAQVPSLAIFRGTILAFDEESGLASLRTACGEELKRVRVNCNTLQSALRERDGVPSSLLHAHLRLTRRRRESR